jgi:alpha-L-fucosidase 2
MPYLTDVENYISKIHVLDAGTNKFRLPLSSTPEYNDNDIKAWFPRFTNYDLALVKNLSKDYAEVSLKATGKNATAIVAGSKLYPDLDTNQTGLTIAPGQNLDASHRHHAHLMAIYPLNVLHEDNQEDKNIISKSLRWLEKMGTRGWCGYSFWLGGLLICPCKGRRQRG